MENLLTVEQLAQRLQVPRTWVYQMTRQRGEGKISLHQSLGAFEWTEGGNPRRTGNNGECEESERR